MAKTTSGRRARQGVDRIEELLEKLADSHLRSTAATEKALADLAGRVGRIENVVTRRGRTTDARPIADPDAILFLRRNDVFARLADDDLARILQLCEIREYERGARLFDVGWVGDTLHVVKSGVVAIQRPDEDTGENRSVAYLGPGDIIGEMGVFTGSSHRSAAVVPEKAEVLAIEFENLVQLLREVPSLALRLLKVLAARLEGAMVTLGGRDHEGRQLDGNLEFFDLSSVIQTLLSTDTRHGVLVVTDARRAKVAEVILRGGNVHGARYGELRGDDAFHQLFQVAPTEGYFTFRECARETLPPIEDSTKIDASGMSLLMEAARLEDELARLDGELPDDDHVFEHVVPQLVWTESASKKAARAIWEYVGMGHTWGEIKSRVLACRYKICRVTVDLRDAGLIR